MPPVSIHARLRRTLQIFDMTALLISSRMGNVSCVEYICSKLPLDEINRTSKALGLSALGDASKCGWVRMPSPLHTSVQPDANRDTSLVTLQATAPVLYHNVCVCVCAVCAFPKDSRT